LPHAPGASIVMSTRTCPGGSWIHATHGRFLSDAGVFGFSQSPEGGDVPTAFTWLKRTHAAACGIGAPDASRV